MANMIITHVLYNIHIYSRIHRDKWNAYRRFIVVWCLKYLVLEPKALTRSCHPSQHEDYAKCEKPILNQDRIGILIAPNPTEINEAMIQKSVSEQHMTMVSLLRGRSNNSMTIKGVMLIRILRTVAEIIRNHGIQHVKSKKSAYPQFSSIFINFLKSWTNPNNRSTPFAQNLTSPTEFYKAFPFPCHSPLARCQWQGLPCLHTGAVWIITKDFEQLLCTAFEADSRHLTISPASKKSRPQWNMGKVENISDLQFLILLLTPFTLLLQGREKKNSQWQDRKTTSTDGTQHQIVQQLYILHMFLMFLFWIFFVSIRSVAPTGSCIGPGWDRPTEASEPQLRTKKSTSVTSMPDESTKLLSFFTTTKNNWFTLYLFLSIVYSIISNHIHLSDLSVFQNYHDHNLFLWHRVHLDEMDCLQLEKEISSFHSYLDQ